MPKGNTPEQVTGMKFPSFFEEDRQEVEAALEPLLPREDTPPASIHRAIRYSVFAGGKRIRPILCLEAARIFDPKSQAALRAGCALEFIHTYSLIHDDLPARRADRKSTRLNSSHGYISYAVFCLKKKKKKKIIYAITTIIYSYTM